MHTTKRVHPQSLLSTLHYKNHSPTHKPPYFLSLHTCLNVLFRKLCPRVNAFIRRITARVFALGDTNIVSTMNVGVCIDD